MHGFKDEDACLRTRELPKVFRWWERERAGCVQDQDQAQAQFRVGDGTWRLKLVGQLAPGGTWTKSSIDTNDSEDQDRHVWALCLVESMPGGDARRRKGKAVHTRGCDDDVGIEEETRRAMGTIPCIRPSARLPALAEW